MVPFRSITSPALGRRQTVENFNLTNYTNSIVKEVVIFGTPYPVAYNPCCGAKITGQRAF